MKRFEFKILVYVNEDCKVDSRGVRIRKYALSLLSFIWKT